MIVNRVNKKKIGNNKVDKMSFQYHTREKRKKKYVEDSLLL